MAQKDREIRFSHPVLPGRALEEPDASAPIGPVTRKIRRAESALQQRVEFEGLVSKIASFFVTLKSDVLDWGICEALREIGVFVGVDHAHVFRVRENGTIMDHTHGWSADKVVSPMDGLQNKPLQQILPWSSERLSRLDGIAVFSVGEMKPEARVDQAIFKKMGIKSIIFLPMAVGGELVGFLGFDSTRMEMEWTQDAITLLNIVGAIIADALQRKASEDELRKEATFSTAVLNSSGAMCIVLNTSAQIVRFNTAAEQVTGYTAAEVLGRPPWDLFISKDELPLMRRIFRRLASGSPPVSQEGSVISKTREKAAVSWLLTSITNRDDQVDFVILSGLDVSEMKRLEAEVLDVSEREQSRFGHDLHDGLGQHLTGIEFMARVLEQKLESENHPLSAQASQITALVRDAISQTRDLARGLSPVVLQAKGIGVALADLAKSVSKRHSIACDCHIAENCEIQRLETATHLYRIAQEAVNNALKHADPKKIIISLTRENDRFVLCVEDDGKAGFAPSGQGMGLRVMNYRAGIIGGTMEIEQKPKGGVMVICRCE